MTERRRSSSIRRVRLLGIAAAATLLVTLMGFAGTHPYVRFFASVCMLAMLCVAITVPQETLARTHGVHAATFVTAIVTVLCALTLIPIPRVLGVVLSPGWELDRHPSTTWSSVTLDPVDTLETWAAFPMIASFGAVTVVALTSARAVRAMEWMTAAWTATLVVLGLLVFGPTDNYLSVYAVPDDVTLFGPFVNPNHLAAALLLTTPLHLWSALNARQPALQATLFTCGLGMLVHIGAAGPLAILGAQLALVVAFSGHRMLSGVIVLVGVIAIPFLASDEFDTTFHGRVPIWLAALRSLPDHWAAGSGLGTFATAVEPYRLDSEPLRWNHAHNDVVGWMVETGILGVVVAVATVVTMGWVASNARRSMRGVWIGLLGLLLHSLMESPVRSPAIALAAVGLFIYATRPSVPAARGVRASLSVLLVMQLGATAWFGRSAFVRSAIEAAREGSPPSHTARLLAPREPELWLSKDVPFDADDAIRRFWRSAVELRRVAVRAQQEGQTEAATAAIERAVTWSPSDYQNWYLRALLAEKNAPDLAHEAWADLFRNGATPRRLQAFHRAYATLPVGVYWVDVASSLLPSRREQVARMLLDVGEPEAALLIHEELVMDGHDGLGLVAARAMMRTERSDDAEPILRSMLETPHRLPALKQLAPLLERQERWQEAVDVRRELHEHEPGQHSRRRWLQAHEHAAGPDATLHLIDQLEAEGATLSQDEVALQADLYARAGDRASCRQTLQSSRLARDPVRLRRALERCE